MFCSLGYGTAGFICKVLIFEKFVRHTILILKQSNPSVVCMCMSHCYTFTGLGSLQLGVLQ